MIAGAYTSPFTRTLLARLGYPVVALAPETTIADIEDNVRLVAELRSGKPRAASGHRRDARRRARAIAAQPARAHWPLVVRPGGFTVGAGSLADELMTLAGLRNVAAEQGLDRWGSLSMETLLRSTPELIILTGYRTHAPVARQRRAPASRARSGRSQVQLRHGADAVLGVRSAAEP